MHVVFWIRELNVVWSSELVMPSAQNIDVRMVLIPIISLRWSWMYCWWCLLQLIDDEFGKASLYCLLHRHFVVRAGERLRCSTKSGWQMSEEAMVREEIAVAVKEDRTGEYRMPVVVSSYYRQGRSDWWISVAGCCLVVLSTGKMATVMWRSPRLYVLSNPRTVVVHGGEQQNLVMSSIWSDVYSITDGTLSLVMFTWCTKSLLCVMLCSVWMWSAKFALVVFVCSSFLLAAYLRSHPCSWHFAHTYHQCCVPSWI